MNETALITGIKKRVLAVEDNAVTRKLLERNLTRWGYEPLLACDGEEAWQLIQQADAPPHLMIFDWDMPKLTGIELCERVRALKELDPTYIIMVTGRDDIADVVAGLDSGADDYLRKPFDPAELRSRIGVGMRMLNTQLSLTRSERKYRDLVQSAHSIILRLTPDRVITFANPFCESVLGTNAQDLKTHSFRKLLHPDQQQDPLDVIPSIHAGPEPLYNAEVACNHPQGTIAWIAWSFKAVRDPQGQLIEILAIGNDVTDRRLAESSLVHQERIAAVGLLAAGVAHQFNNIHTGVLGHAQLLLLDDSLSEDMRESLGRIVENLRRATDITQKLFQITHAGQQQKSHLPLQELVEGLIDCIRPEFEDLEITLTLSYGQTPSLPLSKAGISQVLLCLLQNARDAFHETKAPEIVIATGVREQEAYIAVRDNGCGISSEDLDKILLPFFSRKGEHAIGRTPLSHVRGVGLGLALCDAVVREHKGRIEVESKPGEGSCFTIYLPLTE